MPRTTSAADRRLAAEAWRGLRLGHYLSSSTVRLLHDRDDSERRRNASRHLSRPLTSLLMLKHISIAALILDVPRYLLWITRIAGFAHARVAIASLRRTRINLRFVRDCGRLIALAVFTPIQSLPPPLTFDSRRVDPSAVNALRNMPMGLLGESACPDEFRSVIAEAQLSFRQTEGLPLC